MRVHEQNMSVSVGLQNWILAIVVCFSGWRCEVAYAMPPPPPPPPLHSCVFFRLVVRSPPPHRPQGNRKSAGGRESSSQTSGEPSVSWW